VLTYAQARSDLERGGVDRVLAYTFLIGSAAGLALALLAVGFSVAAGARARGQALSRLRTMGLAPGQGRRLIAYELLPLIALGALVGAVVGAAIPRLIGPALGLSAFSDGAEVVFVVDPRLAAVAFGVVVLAVVVAMIVEAMINRRARLGAVLRVGGES
jgi:putative ABC transport system permease protein